MSLLAQGSEAMRDPTKTLEEPSKASLADPVPSGDAPARRLADAPLQNEAELQKAVKAWLDKDLAGWAEYGEIKIWDVSRITDMSELFKGVKGSTAEAFNDDIGAWDTARVKFMDSMFDGASAFDQNIGEWDTASVKGMGFMFSDAKSFNQNIGAWDTGSVVSMSLMFHDARVFNQDLGWCVSSASIPVYSNADGVVFGTPCASKICGVTFVKEHPKDCPSGGSGNNGKVASPDVIVVACVAAAVLLVAALFVWNKRAVAHKQPHRETSMLTIGREDREGDVEVAESADQ